MPRRPVSKQYESPPPFVPDGGRYYAPTPSIDPPRPRTLEASYHAPTRTLRVRFREGAVYAYYDVPPLVWKNFRRVKSPGRFINRRLNFFEYGPEEVGDEFGPMPREVNGTEEILSRDEFEDVELGGFE